MVLLYYSFKIQSSTRVRGDYADEQFRKFPMNKSIIKISNLTTNHLRSDKIMTNYRPHLSSLRYYLWMHVCYIT